MLHSPYKCLFTLIFISSSLISMELTHETGHFNEIPKEIIKSNILNSLNNQKYIVAFGITTKNNYVTYEEYLKEVILQGNKHRLHILKQTALYRKILKANLLYRKILKANSSFNEHSFNKHFIINLKLQQDHLPASMKEEEEDERKLYQKYHLTRLTIKNYHDSATFIFDKYKDNISTDHYKEAIPFILTANTPQSFKLLSNVLSHCGSNFINENTLLHGFFTQREHKNETLSLLLDHKADINSINAIDISPLELAIIKCSISPETDLPSQLRMIKTFCNTNPKRDLSFIENKNRDPKAYNGYTEGIEQVIDAIKCMEIGSPSETTVVTNNI